MLTVHKKMVFDQSSIQACDRGGGGGGDVFVFIREKHLNNLAKDTQGLGLLPIRTVKSRNIDGSILAIGMSHRCVFQLF